MRFGGESSNVLRFTRRVGRRFEVDYIAGKKLGGGAVQRKNPGAGDFAVDAEDSIGAVIGRADGYARRV